MSEKTTDTSVMKTACYKTTWFPWLILWSISVATIFFIGGSFYEKNQQGAVEARASAMVEQLTVKTPSKQ
jgi:hypothetical protein